MKNYLVILTLGLVFTGCKQLSSLPGQLLSGEDNIKIAVKVAADGTINPGREGSSAQPVKTCVFIVKNKFWNPDGLYDGIPCNDAANNPEVVEYKELMASPNQTYEVDFDLVYRKKDVGSIWVLVGANFQQINNFQPLDRAEIKKKKRKVLIPVKISRNKISVRQENDKNNVIIF